MNFETYEKFEKSYNEILELEKLIKLKRSVLYDFYDFYQFAYYRNIYKCEDNFTYWDLKYIKSLPKIKEAERKYY